ncbi:MAG: hypothetical protein ABEH78_02545 [Haloferacaceae archaeon]
MSEGRDPESGSGHDARGVSDVIGFVFVFSLIVASVSIVSVVGLGGLQETRSTAHIENTELAFDVLANNIEDIQRRRAPARATEIRLGGGGLTTGNETVVRVTVDGVTTNRTIEPIVYEFDDTRIVYESTAVLRSGRGGAVFVREPTFVLPDGSTPNRTAIPLVDTDVSDDRIGGRTTVLVRTTPTSRSVINDTDDTTVTMKIETTEKRAAAWDRYLDDELPDSDPCSHGGGEAVTCTFDTSRVVVSSTQIVVDYE